MSRVYIVPAQFIDFLRGVVGAEGSRLNLNVKDIHGNTVVGVEEWNAPEFAYLHEQYPEEAAQFVEIEYEPAPIFNPFETT